MAKPQCTRCDLYCFYCDAPLPPRHEHDHFPIPKEKGGAATVPACMNCHELKDRTNVDQWPLGALMKSWKALTPPARIFVAKVIRLMYVSGLVDVPEEGAR